MNVRQKPQEVLDFEAARAANEATIRQIYATRGSMEMNLMVQYLTSCLQEVKNSFLTISPDQFEVARERAKVFQELLDLITKAPMVGATKGQP